MSTRGLYGFKTERDYYLIYSPSDSFPESLGEFWFNTLAKGHYDLNQMKNELHNCVNVVLNAEENPEKQVEEKLSLSKEEAKITIENFNNIAAKNDLAVFDAIYNEKLNYFLNDKKFMNDGLFCEWVYYYNYETERFVAISNNSEQYFTLNLTDNFWSKNLVRK